MAVHAEDGAYDYLRGAYEFVVVSSIKDGIARLEHEWIIKIGEVTLYMNNE